MDTKKYGPWALIVGGSEGVGASFARKLAAEGLNLVLVARKPEPLEALARQIRADAKVEVRALSLDITSDNALDQVRALTDDVAVGLLIYNAGANHRTMAFHDSTLDAALTMIRLNVVGQTAFAYHFGEKMRRRGRGGIILIGSMAGYAGSAKVAVYSAAKSFSHTLAEALWFELKPHGVDVLGLVLGLTRTPAMERAGFDFNNPQFPACDPEIVAQEGLDRLAAGPIWIAGGYDVFAKQLASLSRGDAVALMSQGANDLQPD